MRLRRGRGWRPGRHLRQAAAKLGDIRSGDLDFRLAVEPKGSHTDRVGWEVKGPFELGGGGRPLRFQVDYTQRRGDKEATVSITLTGGRAYVALGGETYEAPAARARALTRAGTALAGGEGLGELDIGKDDRLLRRLRLELDLGPDVPGALRTALWSAIGAEVDLELTIEHPNRAVSIQAPLDPHPTSEFPGG